jgi:hypothetical protein
MFICSFLGSYCINRIAGIIINLSCDRSRVRAPFVGSKQRLQHWYLLLNCFHHDIAETLFIWSKTTINDSPYFILRSVKEPKNEQMNIHIPSLIPIGPVVSGKKIKIWELIKTTTTEWCKMITIAHLKIISRRVIDCSLMLKEQFSAIKLREPVTFRPDDDVCFVLDQPK